MAGPQATPTTSRRTCQVAIVGAGPAGLFAAELLAGAGLAVTLFDRMPSPARKFLMAGRGGLNLTHSEPREPFLKRYGAAAGWLQPGLDAFPPAALRSWAEGLGEPTFVGSSGRVFPKSFKASPLTRAWLARLASFGVDLLTRHRFLGIGETGELVFEGPDGGERVEAQAVLLALGGASWPRLGSDGDWVSILAAKGVPIAPLAPANMGVEIDWSSAFVERFAGQPLKRIAVTASGHTAEGEAIVTASGLEGGAIYALSGTIREGLGQGGNRLLLDLKPDLAPETVIARLEAARPKDSLSSTLKKRLGLSPQAVGLLHEAVGGTLPRQPQQLGTLIKRAPLAVRAVRPIARAISSAGGIRREAVTATGELVALPGIFVAGEMLDWEAPTGGYLLQATFATAATAARGVAQRLGVDLPFAPSHRW
jgi:uncharacterized flavoprotein (TIGR03862 family)